VLAIDTVAPVIGVALRVGGESRERVERVSRGAETRLTPWVLELCAEAGLGLRDLDGIAVSRGPGSFTGLRVGLATAAGLALGLDVPLWGAMSLAPRAHRVAGEGSGVLALLDARRQRVYAAWYPPGASVRGPEDIDPAVAVGWAAPPFVATGEGAIVYEEQVLRAGGRLAPGAGHPAVDALAWMGEEALLRGEGRDAVEVVPLYLRAPDAQPPAPPEGKRTRSGE